MSQIRVSIDRIFAGLPFDAAKVRSALESLSQEIGVGSKPEIIGSVTRASGARETIDGNSLDLVWSFSDGTAQFIEVDWRLAGEVMIGISLNWLEKMMCTVRATDEKILELSISILIRDLGLSAINSQARTPAHHLGDNLAQALRSLDEVLWARWVQAGRDLNDRGRLSYHGPVHDMRDVLASVLRSLAPDEAVRQQPWFVQVRDANGPTQSQRARYILAVIRNRGSKSYETADHAIQVIADLARALYSRGSVAHVKASREEACQIYRYASAVLSDLLGVEGR